MEEGEGAADPARSVADRLAVREAGLETESSVAPPRELGRPKEFGAPRALAPPGLIPGTVSPVGEGVARGVLTLPKAPGVDVVVVVAAEDAALASALLLFFLEGFTTALDRLLFFFPVEFSALSGSRSKSSSSFFRCSTIS